MIFRSKGMRRASLAAIPILAIAGSIGAATTSNAASNAASPPGNSSGYSDGRYIVSFADDPVGSYDGYNTGFKATKPKAGNKLDPNSASVKAWRAHLTSKHDAALAKVGATKIYDYTITNNGIAADLTKAQAAALAKTPGVVALERDKVSQVDTTASPEFLGLNAAGGVWAQAGGQANAGAGVVVGVIDSGIWPENPSFANEKINPRPKNWHGACVAGENFPVTHCGNKLVGARYYVEGFGKKNIADEDYLSPRDGSGHGSHTASTAAGNAGVTVTIDGKQIGTASGMAPAASVAMYKVCWEGKPGVAAGCYNSDSVAAINDAVLDGVDVLNYSIGGSSESSVLDSVAQAFRAASNVGIFVANSAGNNGPGTSTLDHPAPWVTTVAAATFRKAYQAVALGNGARYVGASTTSALNTPAPLITALSGKLAGASDNDAKLCFDGTLDPAKVTGKVVICDRGVNARIDKSFEVKRAGGVGMVMTNTSPNSLNGDYHPIPSVHLNNVDGAAVKAYAATAGATASIVALTPAELAAAPDVPEITDFSSRGPSTTTDGDILKPDIAAPGNDVVAAVAPPSNHGRSWDFYSGTSMSSPHIAGIGALMKQQHPTWLPSEIKSALMTSAVDTKTTKSPFAQGAGFVNPNSAVDPGLVYPAGPNDYRSYMVSLGVRFAPPFDTLPPVAGPDLNQASIAIGGLAGVQTVARTVKNVGTTTATYNATVDVPGFTAVVSPSSFTLAPNATQTFTVTFTRATTPLGVWATGNLTWSDGKHSVRSPIALRPVAVKAPSEVSGTIAAGSATYSVTPGSTAAALGTSVAGLVGVAPVADSIATGPFDTANPVVGAGTKVYHVTVPEGTKAARFDLVSNDKTADLDLFVYKGGTLVGLSASGSADERATLNAPAAGTYDVYVNGFATPGGTTSYAISNWVVPNSAAGNLSVSNPAVTAGVPATLTATWTGLDPAKRYFGVISYAGATNVSYITVG
ncbi:S8 family serine peptidase [Dactylosporangium sp. AC04546]|uniref:S8 family serine peptidase n=1 Tax=Dactylosporangium sp. AC04546 TaxID=2862460 RepID=UPI001EDDA6F9|nr:S8 family serine peptidase [Dactylosporangium sp. AC04546]WVK84236.1 S8 family serine peptidase [Dactylosporangium sp. AC04546]